MSLHLYVGARRYNIGRTYSEAAIYNSEIRECGGRGCFFSPTHRNAEGILSLDYNQDDPREGRGRGRGEVLRIKDATVSNKEVAV